MKRLARCALALLASQKALFGSDADQATPHKFEGQ
jgi:hypothetical protein